jgi:hypothetical protein
VESAVLGVRKRAPERRKVHLRRETAHRNIEETKVMSDRKEEKMHLSIRMSMLSHGEVQAWID